MNIKTKQFSKKIALFVASFVAVVSVLYVAPITVSAQGGDSQQIPKLQPLENFENPEARKKAENDQKKATEARKKAEIDNYFGQAKGGYQCGKGPNAYKTRINFGCLGPNAKTDMNPIEDLLFAAVRFLSYGVGVVLVGSMIWAGIQYSTSEGNPESTQAAKNRIRDAVIGLFIYLFAFALVQYLVPGGLFN